MIGSTYHYEIERVKNDMSLLNRVLKPADLTRFPVHRWPNYLRDLPAIPIMMSDLADTLVTSLKRKAGLKPVKLAATEEYTINNRSGSG